MDRSGVPLADALANAGCGEQAGTAYLAAADSVEAAESLVLRRMAATQFLISGHIDRGLATLRCVLAAVGMKLPESPRRGLLALVFQRARLGLRGYGFRARPIQEIPACDLAWIDIYHSVATGLGAVDPICAAGFHTRGLLGALRAGEPSRVTLLLALEIGQIAIAGGTARRRVERLLAKADALSRQLGDPRVDGSVRLSACIAACLQGRWKRAVELGGEAEAIFRQQCTGVAWELNTAQCFPLVGLYWMGQFAELSRRVPLLLEEARRRGNLYALNNAISFSVPIMAATDPEEAERQLQQSIDKWSHEGFHVQHFYALQGQVMIHLYRGDGPAAWRYVTDQWPALAKSLLLRVQNIRITMHETRARCTLAAAGRGNAAGLWQEAICDAEKLESEKMPWAGALAGLIRAAVAAARGENRRARMLLENAVAGFDAADMALYAACARRRLGELIGGDAGQALVSNADAWMLAQQIHDPICVTRVHAPGFPA